MKTLRREFPRAVRVTVITRATDMQGRVWCEQCGAECLTKADYELDHVVAEGVLPANDNRVQLTANDARLLCLACHDKKSRRDLREISKTKRLEGKHRPIDGGPSEIARRYGLKQEPHR